MRNLCIIPARGGSKRIPRKNIRDFLGKPIIAYSIEAALNSGLFEEVMVSTDDKEIAEIAQKYGAKVPFFRSEKNANDFATTADVIKEVMADYTKTDKEFDNFCCCYPTAPFISSARLNEGLKQLQSPSVSSVFPVAEFGYPILRSLKMEDDGRVSMNWPDQLNARSQDLPKAYHDAGQWYWMKTTDFLSTGKIIGENSYGLQLEAIEVQDIDNEIDWKLAELKYELLQSLK
jgi:pseudaminic acid cytidylyltransferase